MTGYNEYIFIEDGFRCRFGKNIRFHGMSMINYDCTFLDTDFIDIGHCVLIGPGCKLICTNHSIDPAERLKGVFCDKPIKIGNNVWLGANVTVLPGRNDRRKRSDRRRVGRRERYSRKRRGSRESLPRRKRDRQAIIFENDVWMYKCAAIADMAKDFLATQEQSIEYHGEMFKQTIWRRFVGALVKTFAPLL